MYATKRRQRNFKRVREAPKPGAASNPSKRHRERLNGELETVASLLPYEQTVISRLDKLSVLRLAVSFLQAKTHFQISVQKLFIQHPYYGGAYGPSGFHPAAGPHTHPTPADRQYATEENIFKALGGFILILNENGEIYYTSDNIETYLGFHQSDILHQPVFDMIHSEDREELRQQLLWNYNLPATSTTQELFPTGDGFHLERNASARFRCLLDNTCGFLRIDIRGKLTVLNGLPNCYLSSRPDPNVPVLGLLAVCTPFVPPPNIDGPDTEPFLKTKHALDFSLFSMDSKAKLLLEMDDKALPISFYQIVHFEDAPCLGEAHKEVVKNGASGLLVYRVVSKITMKTYWLQSSCRLFYKNGKPESIGSTHRLLTEVEGYTLLEKRASLSAKLLSFDDSLLQSPKLLQSTAALPTSAPAQKLRAKKYRPSTTAGNASIRDPAARVNSVAFRSAAAAAALAANSALFVDPATATLATMSAAGLPYGSQTAKLQSQPPVASSSWLNSSKPTAAQHYYGYFQPQDYYGSSSQSSYNAYYGRTEPVGVYPAQIIPPTTTTFAYLPDSTCTYSTTDWNYVNADRPYRAANFYTDKNLLTCTKDARKTVAETSMNFSISEVTNTLLGQ